MAPVGGDLNLRIRRFEPKTMLLDRVSLFVGRRGSGKSMGMEDILYNFRHIPSGICFSGTEDANPFWYRHIPQSFIYDDWQPQVLQRLISRQRRTKKRGLQMSKAFVVAEDVLYSNEIQHDKTVRQLFQNGRHFGITLLMSMQFCLDMPPHLRTNTD